ncbi:sulfite exporter TauE/SafE family protein [Larkinella soli]|uniref:sulfite exporter TauE/SafE family protein n=1 Tax=Larkinella soli TaxID=1770527 RepID=UPI000FFC5192|nr:sulfite exporter TauE/SafE family protein [Larkinella soli]
MWHLTALFTGLAGSLHCVGMCGPLAMALPVGRLPRYQRVPALLLYHGGRIGAYALLGLMMGLTGQALLLTGLQRPVSIGAGVLLLIWTITSRTYPQALRNSALGRRLTAPIARSLAHPTPGNFLAVGFFNGLLPCGFVYVAMTGALAHSTALDGALYMALFGMGTLPALLGVRLIPSAFPLKVRQRFQAALPVMTIVLALLLIGRGLIGYSAGHRHDTERPEVPICHGV